MNHGVQQVRRAKLLQLPLGFYHGPSRIRDVLLTAALFCLVVGSCRTDTLPLHSAMAPRLNQRLPAI